MITHDEEHIKDIYRCSGMQGLVEYEKDLMEEYSRVNRNVDILSNGPEMLDYIGGLIRAIEVIRFNNKD